jgi:NAD(P)-dependent dehydrogenase (short-subunit alcohol dehydrogenase family)
MSGVALITGAASGIGLATARAFAPRVASLVLSDLNEAPLTAFAAELRADFPRVDVLPFVGDMGVEADIVAMHAEAKKAFGRVDYAVNNAGIAALGRMGEFKTADVSPLPR